MVESGGFCAALALRVAAKICSVQCSAFGHSGVATRSTWVRIEALLRNRAFAVEYARVPIPAGIGCLVTP